MTYLGLSGIELGTTPLRFCPAWWLRGERDKSIAGRRTRSSTVVSKQLPFLDNVRDLRRHHDPQSEIAGRVFRQHVARKKGEKGVIVTADRPDEAVFQEIGVEVLEVGRHGQIAGRDDRARGAFQQRIDVESQ